MIGNTADNTNNKKHFISLILRAIAGRKKKPLKVHNLMEKDWKVKVGEKQRNSDGSFFFLTQAFSLL